MVNLLVCVAQKRNKNFGWQCSKFKINRLSELSLFDQLYEQIHFRSSKVLKTEFSGNQPFEVDFVGEHSIDQGGPFRDFMENLCAEITTRFFTPTANASA